MTWAPWDMPDGTFQRVYDLLSVEDRRAMREVSRKGKALVNAHARSVNLAPAGQCTKALRKKDVKILLDSGPMYRLRRLQCRLGTFGLISAKRLVKAPSPRLRALDLAYSDLDVRIISTLAGSDLRFTMEDLRLASSHVELDEIVALSAVTWPSLRRLDLSWCIGNDETLERREAAADALVAATPALQSLDVSRTFAFAASCLARLAGWTQLDELRIVSMKSREGLPPAGACGGLKVLSLESSRIEDQDFVKFIASNSATIESLSLAYCKVREVPLRSVPPVPLRSVPPCSVHVNLLRSACPAICSLGSRTPWRIWGWRCGPRCVP
jgi:hypothetical protein